ncbi:MAG: VanW family protein, partial [Actinobacteria bacterium]|nr:VanW family protein [Actinomycetota bacterium]
SERRTSTTVIMAVVAVLALLLLALAGIRLAHRGEVVPGVSVEDVDLGGLTPEEARSALAGLAGSRETDPVELTFRDERHVITAEEVDYDVDLEATVDEAMSIGRKGGVIDRTWRHVTAFWQEETVELVEGVEDDALDARLDAIAGEVDRGPFPGDVTADPATLEVTSQPPADGVEVDVAATREVVLEAFSTPGPQTVELPVEILPARIDPADVEEVARQAREALDEPLRLRSPNRDVTLAPAQLAPLISLVEREEDDGSWTVELDITPEETEELFAELAGDFEVAPVDARFETPREPPVTFDAKTDATWRPRPFEVPVVPSRNGLTFDPELAAAQMAELLQRGVHDAELRLAEVQPELSTEQARDLNIDTLLSTFTTYHACCQTRVNNIQRLADMVDGTIVRPGEQFSINQISGERTCSKGFQPAGMILRGEIVDVCGGGVSQFGTTTVNAVFFAGIEPDAYQPHSFYISRYPMGREATLNFPTPDIDVKFTNETGNGILVRTSHTSTSITVTFYGSNDVEQVRAIHGQPTNTKPYPTEYRENKALRPQSSRTIQSGRNGFSIKVTREITYEDGSTETDDWSNVYVPEREIIERNTSPRQSAPPPSSPPPSSPPPEERPPAEEEPPQDPPPSGNGGGGGGGGGGDG